MYLSHIFPELSCVYSKNTNMNFRFGISDSLPTDLKFEKDRVIGQISPRIEFYAGGEFAFSLAFTATLDSQVSFSIDNLMTVVKSHINQIDFKDWIFVPGTVKKIDLIKLATTWNPWLLPMIVKNMNELLGNQGIEFGVISALKDIFNIDIQTLYFKLEDGYLESSLNLDIYKKMEQMYLNAFPFKSVQA